ncbi:MAG TPA: DNA primase [Candidatus Saccharimonadales bacterium]|nr:DNA primase [Candidatus Saccharimonadales bacterium]
MDAVEEIKQRLNIEDVVSQYVELKRAGRNFKGLSPFANEKSPSFIVSPEKQIWHDFSSGKGGNMFSFVMEMEGLDFKGALELLARKAGIDLEQYRGQGSGARGKEKERLYEALELATRFYQVQFTKSREALAYVFKKRQFTKETALEWRLGYSPNNGTALVDFLKGKGFSENEIKGAGLSAQRYRGLGDMFRGRFMIPLCDQQGRVIGFTARILIDDPNAPKYINTPQTMLYDKSRHVFGLHLAKEMIRKSKFVVIAEGNLDVISSHQAGVRQVVATAGTALTEPHLKALSRFTGDIRLSFDADNAGMNATERAIPIASKVNVSLSIITIPSGKDPDELIKQDVNIWRETITKPQYALDWLIERYRAQLDITSAQGKRQFSDIILAVVKGLADQVEREHYIEHVGELIGVSKAALESKMDEQVEAAKPQLKTPRVAHQVPDKVTRDYLKTQNHFLALTLMQPALRPQGMLVTEDMMLQDQAKGLLKFLREHPDFTGKPDEVDELRPLADYVKILVVHYEDLYQDVELHELEYEIAQVRSKLIEQYVKMQKQRLAHDLQTTDEAETKRLLEQVNQLNDLLRTYKRGT